MMKQKAVHWLKKNWLHGMLVLGLCLLQFHPEGKPWVLRQLFAVGLFRATPPGQAAPVAAGTSTNLTFHTADGRLLQTGSLKGTVLFINFWAKWCPPCRAEMPSIYALAEQLKGDPAYRFLMVEEEGDAGQSASFLQDKGWLLPVYSPGGPIPETLYNGTLPTTLVIDATGKVVFKKEGVANYHTEAFLRFMKQLKP